MLTIQNNSLRGTVKGQNISGSLRRNPSSMRVTPGRYKVVQRGVDPVLGGVIVLQSSAIASCITYQTIQSFRSPVSLDTFTLVISARALGGAASLVLDGVPRDFYALPEVGDEVVVS